MAIFSGERTYYLYTQRMEKKISRKLENDNKNVKYLRNGQAAG